MGLIAKSPVGFNAKKTSSFQNSSKLIKNLFLNIIYVT